MFLDLLKQELGESKEASGELRFKCPFCGERKYKFYVNVDNSSQYKDLWICFKCSETGNPISFVKKYFNVDYVEAVDILKTFDYDVNDMSNGDFNSYKNLNELSEEEKLLLYISRQGEPMKSSEEEEIFNFSMPSPPKNCKTLISNFNNPEAFLFFNYLHNRGVSLDQIRKHNISYVTHGSIDLKDGRTLELHNHLVFYTYGSNGKALYWNTRSIEPNPFIKTFNAPSRNDEYSKNNTIFNLNNAENTDKIVVTEGVFDAMTIGNSGVATFGKKITQQQIDLLIESSNNYNLPIYLFLDSDADKEIHQTIENVQRSGLRNQLYLVMNNTDQDANDLGTEKCYELINNAVVANTESILLFDVNNFV